VGVRWRRLALVQLAAAPVAFALGAGAAWLLLAVGFAPPVAVYCGVSLGSPVGLCVAAATMGYWFP
jgi:hypothetical protein